MRAKAPRVPYPAATCLTLVLLAARLFPLPPLRDALGGAAPAGVRLAFPAGYLLLQPFSAFADFATLGSLRQDKALIAWLLLGYWIVYALRRPRPSLGSAAAGYASYLALVLATIGWAVLAARPAARLERASPDDLVVDFHSHTSHSKDARRSFSPAANIEWHRRAGFDAGFVTDHNNTRGAVIAKSLSRAAWEAREPGETPYRSLEGEELSLQNAHVVVLHAARETDNKPFDGTHEGLLRFLRECSQVSGGIAFMSLPEYWKHHPAGRWEEFVKAGARGFELSNASPKALEVPAADLARAAELSHAGNLPVLGVTDSHGWGAAPSNWSVMRIPGHAALGPDALELAVRGKLESAGFAAVRIVERTRRPASPGAWVVLDPPLGAWTMLRTFSWTQIIATLAWVWGAAFLRRKLAGSRP